MLDVENEIKRLAMENDSSGESVFEGELTGIVAEFTKVLKRLGKDQYRYANQMEEILVLLEEQEQHHNEVKMFKEQYEKNEQESGELLHALLGLADSLEDVYRYALKSGDGAWHQQMNLQWDRAGQILSRYGITRIEGEGDACDLSIHTATAVGSSYDMPHGYVLEVVRSGYMYKGRIIRKAEVVINRIDEHRKDVLF